MDSRLPFDVPTTRVTKGYSAFRAAVLDIVDPFTAVIRPSRKGWWILALAGAAGIPTSLFILWILFTRISPKNMPAEWSPHLIWLILGFVTLSDLVVLVVGDLGATGRIGKKPIVIDRKSGWAWEQKRGSDEPAGDAIRLRDVAVVQVCSGRWGWGQRQYTVFEVNLVLSVPPGRRVNLVSHLSAEPARADAEPLAAFLKVPLLDHATSS